MLSLSNNLCKRSNLVKSSEVYDGAGNRAAKTDYEYDNSAVVNGTGNPNLKATPGVTMHNYTFDPYTSEVQDGECLERETVWVSYGDPYNPEWGYWDTYCIQYEQVSAYDANTIFRGNVTKVTGYADALNASGAISQTKQYDVTGNLVAESASCCELKTYDYTTATQYAYPTTQTRGSSDPNSTIRNLSTAVYDFYTGLVKQTTDPNGRTDSTVYDADTLRPTVSTSSTGAYSSTAYDDAAMTITEEIHEYGGNLAGKSVKYLNGIGQVVKQQDLGANNIWDIVEAKYNSLGQPWKRSRPYRTGDTVQWTETTYDLLGRTTQVTEPDGSTSKAFYNETQRPDSATNLAGSTIRVVDAWGRERWGRYDALEKLAEVAEPNPSGNGSVLATGSLITKYTYNTVGNLTQTEQGGQYRYFKYDSLGRLTRQKLAEQTATLNDVGAYTGAGQSGAMWGDAFVYDERSNVTKKTDARGVETHYVYGDAYTGASDPLSRLRVVYYELPSAHDPNAPISGAYNVTYDYMTTGDQDRIQKIETGLAKEEYTYDMEGRVSDYTQTIAYRENYPMTVSYIYDSLSRVTDVRYPAQYGLAGSPRKIVHQSYDVTSRLSAMTYDGNQQAGDIVFNAASQTTSVNIGASGTNQVNEQYTFDPQTGLLTNQKIVRNNTNLLDLSYDYNRNNSIGNLSGKTGHLTKILDNLNHNKDREYQFDALGRLTTAKGGVSGNLWQQNYTYDRWGNRTNVTASGVAADNSQIPLDGTPHLSYDQTSNRINISGYQYDVAGNQIRGKDAAGNWIRMVYDYAGRLQFVNDDNGNTKQGYNFSPSGGRLMNDDYTSGQKTFYLNLGGTTLTEYVEPVYLQPGWSKSYTYFGDSQLATITPNGSGGEYIEFNHPDQLGTRVITNQPSGASYEQKTLPFGTALNAESTVQNNNKRFTSYDRSPATGLDYAVNRTYDSKLGRFTQVDPIGMSASSLSNPQTLNLYSYCGNDPINHTDPNGLFFGSLFKWIGKAFKVFNKILKWVVVAIVVVAVIIAVVKSGGAAMAFLSKLMGLIGKFGLKSSFLAGTSTEAGVAITGLGIGGKIAAGLYSVGAIASRFASSKAVRNDQTLCFWRNVRITFYDSPKNPTAIFLEPPVQGQTTAADPTAFGYHFPRGTNNTNNIRTVENVKKYLKSASIEFDIIVNGSNSTASKDQIKLIEEKGLNLGNLIFEDVGGGVDGSHIDVYVDKGAKQLGTFNADVLVKVPLGDDCPKGAEPILRR